MIYFNKMLTLQRFLRQKRHQNNSKGRQQYLFNIIPNVSIINEVGDERPALFIQDVHQKDNDKC